MKSMTGYGKGEAFFDKRKYIIEIKSINSKYIDFNFKLPKALSIFEDDIKKYILQYISRGKIEVAVRFENFSEIGKDIKFDEILLKQLLNESNRVSEKYNVENDLKISNIILIDNILKFEQDTEEDMIIKEELLSTLKMAVDNYIAMKNFEGNKIKEDIDAKTNILKINIDKIEKLSYNIIDEYKEKIETRLKSFIETEKIDNNRILTEIIIFADKMTIDEEIVRFSSHVNQMKKELNSDDAIGKKLDFIIQEMNRETNTIGSKTNKLEITQLVIENKAILENIREQIQNIE